MKRGGRARSRTWGRARSGGWRWDTTQRSSGFPEQRLGNHAPSQFGEWVWPGNIPCQSSPGGPFPSTRSRGHPWGWWRRCPSSPAASRGSTRLELGVKCGRGCLGSSGVEKGRRPTKRKGLWHEITEQGARCLCSVGRCLHSVR